MSERAGATRSVQQKRLHLFVLSVAAAGTIVSAGAFTHLILDATVTSMSALGGLLLACALFVVSRETSLAFAWRQHRFGINGDEALLLACTVLLSPQMALVACMVGVSVSEARRRRDTMKALYNVGSCVLAAGMSVTVYMLLLRLGAPPLWTAIVIPPAMVTFAYLQLSCVFSILEGVPFLRILANRFAFIVGVSSMLGVTLGMSALTLVWAHPLAPLGLVPLVLLAWYNARTELRQDLELETRRALAKMSQDLVGCRDLSTIADSVLSTCVQIFDCASVELTLTAENDVTLQRAEEVDCEGPAPVEPLTAEIRGVTGLTSGVLRVQPRKGSRAVTSHDRALARAVAAATAAALETAGILKQLDAAHCKLDTYLNAAEDALLVVDGNLSVPFMNARARELVRKGTPGEWSRLQALLTGVLGHRDKPAAAWEARIPGAGGAGKAILEVRATPLGASGDGGEEILIVARDVTEQRRLESIELRQREVLARSERLASLGTLVAGVAHEVNNPLMYMRGCAELLAMDLEFARDDFRERGVDAPVDFDESLDQLQRVLGGIMRLETIAKNLKSVAQGQRSPTGEVDVGAVIQRVADLVGYGLPPDVSMDVSVDGDLPVIAGDAGALEQALLNLVKNASEAMEDRRGEVAVRARAEDDEVWIEVADEGAGIPDDVRAKLFTPFFTTKNEGTGLGLAFVHTVIQTHGGEIHVDSAEGVGTTFTIRIPVPEAGAEEGEPEGCDDPDPAPVIRRAVDV